MTVKPQSYAWNTVQDEDYILLRYTIKNTSGEGITNLFAGIYIYFKPGGSTSNNITAVNTQNKVGYTYSSSNPDPYLGVAVMTDHNLNFKAMNALDVLTGFTTQEKWDALSNGISADSIGPGLNCMVISAGPLSINAGDSVIIGFAVVKGSSLGNLIANTIRAKSKYGVIGIEKISSDVPRRYELYQNYPNPFNRCAFIFKRCVLLQN